MSDDSKKSVDIMAYINKDKLNLINDTFNKLGTGLNLDQFLQIMLHFCDLKTDDEKIIYFEKLIDAFNQIDVNGDETLIWDEFSNYIVESGAAKGKDHFVNYIRNYHVSTTAKDKEKHENEISKIYFFEPIKHLLVIENERKKILIYNYLTGALITSFLSHNGSVLAAEYLSGQDLVVTSGSDNCLLFWDPDHNYQLMNKIPTRETQITLKWYRAENILFTGGFDQVINVYKKLEFTDTGKLKNTINLASLKKVHNEMITDIIVLKKQKILAVCDLLGLISLWYIQNMEYKDKLQHPKVATQKKRRGVVALSAIEDKNWLLSCGIEHFVIIWDLVVGKHIAILQGHSTTLIGVKYLYGTDQIISGDVGGIFKVWDLRDYSLVQTFSVTAGVNKKAHCFCVTSKYKKKIIIGSDKVYFFDYEEPQEGNLADTKVCINVLYNEVFHTFITAHMNCIKIWDATNGQLIKIFKNLTKNEISSVNFDKRKRKLFIGDVEGELKLVNILNGEQMKYFTSHKKSISAMAYYNEGKKFISASWDGTIKIHDDDSKDEKGLQLFEFSHQIPGKINSCNSIDFSDELKVLACGYDNGTVTLINMKSLSSEGTLSEHKKITVVHFLADYPGMVVCDQDGVHLWSLVLTKPKKAIKDYKFSNYSNNENNIKEIFPIKCICFEKQSNILFMGDETGTVKAYNISEFINYLKLMLPCVKIEYNTINEDEEKKPLSKELQELKEKLLKLPKYDPNKKADSQIIINISDLIEIKNSMDFTPVLEKEFRAHKNGVSSVCCYGDPIFFVSAGHDKKVHIYDREFKIIGSLTTITDKNWQLKINIEEEERKKREEAKKKYEELKDLDYKALFEGESKLPKLFDYDAIK